MIIDSTPYEHATESTLFRKKLHFAITNTVFLLDLEHGKPCFNSLRMAGENG